MQCQNFPIVTYSKTKLLPLLPREKVLNLFIKQCTVKAFTGVKER